VASLEALLKSGRQVPLVVTQPDRPAGRGRKMKSPEVKEYALTHGIEVLQPTKMKNSEFLRKLSGLHVDLFVVAAFGRILPEGLLDIPRKTINVHASLLPRWRGASPIQRAVVAGDERSGVSIMEIVPELDAGAVCHRVETDIDLHETAGELEARLAPLGGKALVEALDLLQDGKANFVPQEPSLVTFAPLLAKSEGEVSWGRPAKDVHNQIRGLNPWPGAYAMVGGRRIKFQESKLTHQATQALAGTVQTKEDHFRVACQDEWLEILKLQPEGKKVQSAPEFLRGQSDFPSMPWDP